MAILFATSVPGRVRLINTDVNKIVTASDICEALPGQDKGLLTVTHENTT